MIVGKKKKGKTGSKWAKGKLYVHMLPNRIEKLGTRKWEVAIHDVFKNNSTIKPTKEYTIRSIGKFAIFT